MKSKIFIAVGLLGLTSASNAMVYLYDDGVSETGLSTSGPAFMNVGYLTKFTTVAGGEIVNSIDIVWGVRTNPNLPNGLSADVLLMSDPNNDGDPNDAAVLAMVATTTVGVGSDTFNNYGITPTAFSVGQNFFAGVFIRSMPTGSAWMALDQNATGAAVNNWWNAAISGPVGSYNSLSIFGNPDFTAMTRVNASAVPEPATMVAIAVGALALLRRRRK
jgi:hypothetical protein